MWHTCKTWKEAVRVWGIACRLGAVDILRKDGRNAATSVSARAPMPPCPSIGVIATRRHASESPLPAPAASAPSVSTSKKLSSIIVVSDSDSYNNNNDDSKIEATSPRPIKRMIDCFELSDDENGCAYFRKTYDAVTDTHFDAPTRPKDHKSPSTTASGSVRKTSRPASIEAMQSHASLQPSPSYKSKCKTPRAAPKRRRL